MVNAFFLNEHSDSPSMFQKLASKKLIAHCDKRFAVERCTGIAEVMGTNPVRAWIFFRSYLQLLVSVVFLAARIS